jgi:hypothetical protein
MSLLTWKEKTNRLSNIKILKTPARKRAFFVINHTITKNSHFDILIYMSKITRQSLLIYATVVAVAFLYVMFAPHSLYIDAQATGGDVLDRKAKLEIELAKVESEINAQSQLVESKQKERVSLERDVAILTAQIDKAKLEIRQRDLTIETLEDDIFDKGRFVAALDDKLENQKESLAQLIRKTNEIDNFSIVEIVLATENISDFFIDLDSFTSIQKSLDASFREIEITKNLTNEQKDILEDRRSEEIELLNLQELQKRKIEDREYEKQRILGVTKGVEASYQMVLDEKKKTAAEIRTALFTLRGSAAIPYDQALTFANIASEITGVRPALLLATFEQESNLGENVGTGNWLDDMHPTRDKPIFKEITERLGLDPNQLPVSKKPWYGWGGAMGPAQFIPSTWILYEDRIGRAAGQIPPNPWDPRTAFIASALLLSDNGADRGTFYAERLAALRYQVMELAEKHQGLIDILEGG